MKIGVADFSQRILGLFDGFMLRNVGETVKQGEEILSVRQRKAINYMNLYLYYLLLFMKMVMFEYPIERR